VLLLESDPDHDFAMRYFNADGGAADYCGNGARCLARFALDLGLGAGGRVRFRTLVGTQEARRSAGGRGIDLHFGLVGDDGEAREVEACGRAFRGRLIVAGVPHFVTAVERLETAPVGDWGRALRRHPGFGAAGANVDFVSWGGAGEVVMRTYERGVEAETLACGSGAIASALWAAVEGAASPVRVRTAGGDVLVVSFERAASGYDVSLTGPAEVAFRGEWPGADPAAGSEGGM
jgi:diaminopimelate epimerase